MPSSLRSWAQQALIGFAVMTHAATIPTTTRLDAHAGLVPREFTLADESKSTIYENLAIRFVKDSSSSAPESPHLARRLSYQKYTTPNGRNDYCGESNPNLSFGATAPLASDCLAIADAYTESIHTGGVKAYWVATANDFANAPGGYLTLASHGTCKFLIKINSGQPLQTVYFGANDLRFYIRGAAQNAQSGKVEALGSVSCNNNTDGGFVSVEYKVTRS